ncbi:MAG TPA: glycosyltransferase family A protein [Gemmataceae bacterium]|nr:glycosyltransferase family A protein [Gemmataceae bacterium]
MAPLPLASVCIPVYNKGPYLARTLEAILRQTYAPLEVIVSDNGSTDGSSDIARAFAGRDPRVRCFRLEHTLNINESWRYALLLAQGEFLKLHSGDDTTLPADFLERMIEPMLHRSEVEFTACAVRPIMDYTVPGNSAEHMTALWGSIAQTCREVIALPNRADRARKLMEKAALNNSIGTPYALVWRRSCLPDAHWSKARTPFAWPESYADWDIALRILLNHRGFFVESIQVDQYYDANSPFNRCFVDNRYELSDLIAQTLLPFNVLVDPEMSALRQQAQPEELAQLLREVHNRIAYLANLSDQVVAFEHPHFTSKLMPRLYQYVDAIRRNPHDWLALRKLRQLRLGLVRRWLGSTDEQIEQEYFGVLGQAHGLLLESGIRSGKLDAHETEVLEKTHAALATQPAARDSWGRWLALVLLTNFRSCPDLTLDMVPAQLRADLARYAWTD